MHKREVIFSDDFLAGVDVVLACLSSLIIEPLIPASL